MLVDINQKGTFFLDSKPFAKWMAERRQAILRRLSPSSPSPSISRSGLYHVPSYCMSKVAASMIVHGDCSQDGWVDIPAVWNPTRVIETGHDRKPYEEILSQAVKSGFNTRNNGVECRRISRKVAAAVVREILPYSHRSDYLSGRRMDRATDVGILSFLIFREKKSLYAPYGNTPIRFILSWLLFSISGFCQVAIDNFPYAQIPEKNAEYTGGNVLRRLIDGLAFAIIGRQKDWTENDSRFHPDTRIQKYDGNDRTPFRSFSNHA